MNRKRPPVPAAPNPQKLYFPWAEAGAAPCDPPKKPRQILLPWRPPRVHRSGTILRRKEDSRDEPDSWQRVPAGGGYRILRRPRLLDEEE